MDTKSVDEKLTLNSFNYNSINPFIQEAVVHIKESNSKSKMAGIGNLQVLDEDSGELKNQRILYLKNTKQVEDKQEWYKMYFGSISRFFHLSKSTGLLWEYLIKNISYNNDRVCIDIASVVDETGMTRSCVYKCLVRLLEAQFIAKAEKKNCYFINPGIAFKGERITLIQEYVLKQDKILTDPIKKKIENK
jgi:hypothetical protein